MLNEKLQITVSACVALFVLGRSAPLPEAGGNPASQINDEMEEERIGIIISPIMSHETIREIAVYWQMTDLQEGQDKLTVYEGQPEANGSRALYSFEPRTPSGVMKTGLRGEFVPTLELSYQDRCLKHYVAWHRNNVVRKVKCLATHPNWMSQRRTTLGGKRLNEIFIPGTHDSGAYSKEEEPQSESVIFKYTITQDEDVLSQLIYGVRYLDIRVGRHPDPDPDIVWWVNHGYLSVHPLRTVIDDVKTFLNNTEEIVIFDIHEFPVGFGVNTSAVHEELVAYLEEQFAGYFLPKTTKLWGTSLSEIWATGKRLIIGYNKQDVYPKHESTWQAVSHRWPNVKTLDELYTKIDEFENSNDSEDYFMLSSRPPSSVMAQFTAEALDVILDLLGGIRVMSEVVNMNITESYNNKWRCSANIVSMDYIKGSGIIEAALEWNDRRPAVC